LILLKKQEDEDLLAVKKKETPKESPKEVPKKEATKEAPKKEATKENVAPAEQPKDKEEKKVPLDQIFKVQAPTRSGKPRQYATSPRPSNNNNNNNNNKKQPKQLNLKDSTAFPSLTVTK